MSPERVQVPFSLAQANEIADAAYCPHCGHKRGDVHNVLQKPWCLHQYFAAERIKDERKIAEQNVTFVKASEVGA